jgi:hypothetical protein
MSRLRRLRLLLLCAFALLCGTALAQAPADTGQQASDQPLRFRLGRVEVSPYIHVGDVSVDTNVYFTPEDRKTDLTANGGPGLRLTIRTAAFASTAMATSTTTGS